MTDFRFVVPLVAMGYFVLATGEPASAQASNGKEAQYSGHLG